MINENVNLKSQTGSISGISKRNVATFTF
uniref:Uncharacterized protein n=1 Tax=Anguilla anguilla TaxID=7936 RepID=A0A0E9PM49_ANGAN